jgi:hypothetical protein
VETVWPVLIWNAHGEGTMLLGVYDSREAAFEAVKAEPNMTAWVDGKGELHGRPRVEPKWLGLRRVPRVPERWAHGHPVPVQSRAPVTETP